MNLQFFIFQLLCIGTSWARTAVEDGQSDEGTVQSVKSPSLRQNPLRLGKSQTGPGSSKVTPPPPPPSQAAKGELEPEYVDEGEEKEYNEDVASSTAASTTEPPKRIGSGFVRPFRSNQDLLETLKRRRQEKKGAVPAPAHSPTTPTTSTSAPSPRGKSNPSRKFNGRNRYSQSDFQSENDQAGSESEKTTTLNRGPTRGRSSFSSTQTYDDLEEESAQPQRAPRFGGRSRRVY